MAIGSRRRDRIARWLVVGLAFFPLSACEPKEIDIQACTFGGKLAFEIADTKGWFSTTRARPWSISVGGPVVGMAWDTQVAYDLIEDQRHTFQPMRSIIVYGIPLTGWEVRTQPQSLEPGADYLVQIWSDGGRGMIDIKGGHSYPACDPVKAFNRP